MRLFIVVAAIAADPVGIVVHHALRHWTAIGVGWFVATQRPKARQDA